ncbi:MAG: response regulator, partial [Acidobacteria bacterium]|nr:response regulator [Acidobacteriota bacterium]
VRVLYMEDDAGLARLFQKHLERAGYEVDLAPDGAAGLARYAEQHYDVLAVDYKMPVRDGLEVITELASSGEVPPTIMLTANGDEELAVEALKLGAADYIVKDTAGGYIRLMPSVIERLLDKHRLEEARRRAQEALRQSEERLREITESASDAIISFDPEGRILVWNRSAHGILGYTAEEASRLSLAALVAPRFRERFDRQVRALQGEDPPRRPVEMTALRKDGRETPVEVSFSRSTAGREQVLTCIMRDITDRQRSQEALQEAARLEATATLASGVAHQFNNLLFGVLGNTELLQMRLEDRPDAIGRLQLISQQALRASEVVQQLLAFARRGQYQPVVLNLADSLREAVQSLEGSAGPEIRIERETDPNLWKVSADPTQMVQLVTNLLSNAIESLDARGAVRLLAGNLIVDRSGSGEVRDLAPGRYVRLEVVDDGCGIAAEILPKIFTPFFTTKFQGRGLGLAAVWGIVKHHGGHVEVTSREGRGTEVRVYLPAVDLELRGSPPPRLGTTAPKGSETILLIDEGEVFLSVTREFLELLGYRVLSATGGREAVALAERLDRPIHLAVLDMNMSAPGSRETFFELIDARPELKVILSSSGEKDALAGALLAAGASAFLRKPFGLDLLGHQVRRALDE